jgi:hypothetical protein
MVRQKGRRWYWGARLGELMSSSSASWLMYRPWSQPLLRSWVSSFLLENRCITRSLIILVLRRACSLEWRFPGGSASAELLIEPWYEQYPWLSKFRSVTHCLASYPLAMPEGRLCNTSCRFDLSHITWFRWLSMGCLASGSDMNKRRFHWQVFSTSWILLRKRPLD